MNQPNSEPHNEHKPFGWIIHKDQIPRLLAMPDKYFSEVARIVMSYCYYGKYEQPDDPFMQYAASEMISRVNTDQKKSNDSAARARKYRENQKELSAHPAPADEKNTYADHVAMTQAEYDRLVSEYGEQDARRMIAILNNHKCAKGVTYQSDYHAILKWVVDALKEERQRAANTAACSDPEENSSYDRDELTDYWNHYGVKK